MQPGSSRLLKHVRVSQVIAGNTLYIGCLKLTCCSCSCLVKMSSITNGTQLHAMYVAAMASVRVAG